jgi:hypothetical protein
VPGTAEVIDFNLLNAAPWQRRHPEFGLVLRHFKSSSYSCFASLLDQRQIDGGTDVIVIRDNFTLVAAPAPCDLAEEAFASLAQPVTHAFTSLPNV